MGSSTAICYVADEGYLFPSLVSAIQAVKHAGGEASVGIFVPTCSDDTFQLFSDIAAKENIALRKFSAQSQNDLRALGEASSGFTDKIPVSSFGRFYLDREVGGDIDEILYIDGDTQIVRPLTPLIRQPVPHGGFLACRDFGTLLRRAGDPAEPIRTDLDKIGLSESAYAEYFNSGVLKMNRGDLAELRAAVLEAWRAAGYAMPLHDQDAFNVAGADRKMIISNRWNFPRHFLGTAAEAEIDPAIIHFMSHPKPWHGVFMEWSGKWTAPYREIVKRYPALAGAAPGLDAQHRLLHKARTVKGRIARSFNYKQPRVVISDMMSGAI